MQLKVWQLGALVGLLIWIFTVFRYMSGDTNEINVAIIIGLPPGLIVGCVIAAYLDNRR